MKKLYYLDIIGRTAQCTICRKVTAITFLQMVNCSNWNTNTFTI